MPTLSWDCLRPTVTLHEIYPAGTVFTSRVSWRWNRWAIPSPALADFSGGSVIPIAGAMPLLVSRAVLSDRVHDALGDRLPPSPESANPYFDESEYAAKIHEAIASGSKMALTYPVPPDEIAPGDCIVAPSLLAELGDKSRLGDWAGAELVPARERVSIENLVQQATAKLPVVVKLVSNEPVAGGLGVRVCRTVSDLEIARDSMSAATEVIVEEWLDLVRSECLTYGVDQTGEVRFLGSAQQMLSGVRFRGNRIDDTAPDKEAVAAGMTVARRSARRGYVGLVGVDYGLLADGSFRLLDLNFRINASSPMVLLREAMLDAIGPHHSVSASWASARPFDDFVAAIRRGCDLGWLLPMAVFDPDASPWNAPLMLFAILVGANRDDIAKRVTHLSNLGLFPLFPF